jgi:transcriptional regulator with XRE-family HTH domain
MPESNETANMNFKDWLLDNLQKTGWSQADLARASGLTRATISYYLGPKSKKPDQDALRKIARAFKMNPATVYRAAGILPPVPEIDAVREEILEVTGRLNIEDQREVLEFAHWRQSRR